jgi:signal transduction histidine kinase
MRKSLTLKLVLFKSLVTSTGIIIGLILGYKWGAEDLKALLVKNFYTSAKMVDEVLGDRLTETAQNLRLLVIDRYTIEALEKGAGGGSLLKDALTGKFINERQAAWEESTYEEAIASGLLDRKASGYLKDLVKRDPVLLEVMLADNRGMTVAASGKITDLYQADEKWWQRLINTGKDDYFIGSAGYDESVGTWTIDLYFDVRGDKGELLGACKCGLDLKEFFHYFLDYRFGKTGLISIVDADGKIILHRGIEPFSIPFSEIPWQQVIESDEDWVTLKGPHGHADDIVIVWKKVQSDILLRAGKQWYIVVGQEAWEVFQPLKDYFKNAFILLAILIIVLVPLTIFISRKLTRPIKDLKGQIKDIGEGHFDRRVSIRTGDEVEDLATEFNSMVDKFQQSTTSLKELNEEIRKRSVVEKKLKEQSEKTKKSLEEALKVRKIMISMLEDNNRARENLEKSLEELKRAQKLLLQSEKLASLGRMASEVAHEVNNPLMAISGRAQLSLMDGVKDDKLRENLQIIKDQCFRATDIMRRLLAFSKPDKRKRKRADLAAVLEDSVKLVEYQFSMQKITIEKDICSGPVKLDMNRNQIEEVFVNILKNAAEAMPGGGTISVKCHVLPGKCVIEFRDTGKGIPREIKDKIFDPFFTTKKEGTGLGLSVCHGIIKAHGGRMYVESEEAKGTIVKIEFPFDGGKDEKDTDSG